MIRTCFLKAQLQMAAIFRKSTIAVLTERQWLSACWYCFVNSRLDDKISGPSGKFGSTVAVQIVPSPEDKQIHADKQKQFSSLKY